MHTSLSCCGVITSTFVKKNNANAYISILLWGHNLRGRSTLPDTMIHNVRK